MRVLVSCDRIGHLGPTGMFDAVAGAFAGRGAQAAVTPVSGEGEGLAEALARFSSGARVLATGNLRQARDILAGGPDYLGVAAATAPELGELLELSMTPARVGAIMMMPHREAGRALTGLMGSLAERGRETGAGIAAALAEDSRVAARLGWLGVTDRAPTGALREPGAWALGYRARVASGIGICVDGYRLSEPAAKADVIVTGTDVLDLHRRGRSAVAEPTCLGVEALRPVVVVASRNFVPSRELCLAEIEEAYAVTPPGAREIDIIAGQLEALVQRMAGTWT